MINAVFLVIGFVSFLGLFPEQLEYELESLYMNATKDNGTQLNTKIFRIIGLHCEAKELNQITLSLKLSF